MPPVRLLVIFDQKLHENKIAMRSAPVIKLQSSLTSSAFSSIQIFAVRLFGNRSQKTSKCSKNMNDTLA